MQHMQNAGNTYIPGILYIFLIGQGRRKCTARHKGDYGKKKNAAQPQRPYTILYINEPVQTDRKCMQGSSTAVQQPTTYTIHSSSTQHSFGGWATRLNTRLVQHQQRKAICANYAEQHRTGENSSSRHQNVPLSLPSGFENHPARVTRTTIGPTKLEKLKQEANE